MRLDSRGREIWAGDQLDASHVSPEHSETCEQALTARP